MGDFQNAFRQLMQQHAADPVEVQRLRLLLEAADKQLKTVEVDTAQLQAEGARSRVDFYDKLTLGSGATIAALVSFLGAHSTKLQPAWTFRGALICLVITMAASLFRNYRYPNYVLQVQKISWIRCCRYEQQCRLNYFKADPNTFSMQTGEPIDVPPTIEKMERSNAELQTTLEEQDKLGESLRKQWTYAQYVAICFATIAMVLLVWLAIANF